MVLLSCSSGLISSVERALTSKLRGPGFKSGPGTITKLPESVMLYSNITEFGVEEDHMSLQVILPHSTPEEGCFVFMPCYSYSFIYPYLTAGLR